MKTINQLRNEKGITQEKLAESIGINQTTISKYERGISYVSYPDKIKIANFFELNIDEIKFNVSKDDKRKQVRGRHSDKENITDEPLKNSKDKVPEVETEIKLLKTNSFIESELPTIIDDCVSDIAIDYLDSVTELIKQLKTDREKFTRLADLKACLDNFNLDTQNHIKREKEREEKIVGKVPVEVG